MNSVESTVRAYFDALNSSDVDGIVGLFAEEGSLMRDESDTLTGRQQIRSVFESMFQTIRGQRELYIDHIRQGGEVGAALTHTSGTVTILANGNTIPVKSRELFVLRKSADGWLITDYMFNRPGSATP